MHNKRMLLVAAAVAAVVTVVAGCSSNPSGSGGSAPGSGPVKGGTLTFDEVTPIQSTDPYPYTGDVIPWRRQVFDTLVGVKNGVPTPELATSWKISSDSKDVTLTLRSGVTFSNGKPFTAQEAKWSIDFAKDPANSSQDGQQLSAGTVTAVDDHTLKLAFPEPTPQVMSVLSDVEMMWSGSDIKQNAIGTGPFLLDQLKPGVEMDLKRNPKYWNSSSGQPYLDKIVIKVVPDANSMVVDLQSGGADMIWTPPANKVATLKSSGYQVVIEPGPGDYDFMMNTTKAPFTNESVREAMSYALDRERFAKIATDGIALPTCQIFPPKSPAYSKSLENCSFDLNKAKQLIQQSGIQTPISVDMTIPQLDPALTEFAPIYQADLKQIGVNANITLVSQAQWIDYAVKGNYPGIMGHIYSFGSLDPAILMSAHPFGPEHNAESYSSSEYSALVTKAEQTAAGPARVAAFEAVSKFVQKAAFIIPVANNPGVFVLGKNIHGFAANALNMPELGGVWKG